MQQAETVQNYPTVIRNIKFNLTEHELAERGKTAAHLNEEVIALEEELDGHKKRLKPIINTKRATIQTILKCLEEGAEERTLECEVKKHFDIGLVEYVYKGHTVDERPMNAEDRQMDLVTPESAVGTESKDEEVKDVMKEETKAKSKHDHLTGPSNGAA